jgi:mono/diheme cytochrome c family protein
MPALPHDRQERRKQRTQPLRRGQKVERSPDGRQIVNGSKVMPPFGDVFDDKDLADLLSYLRSCKSEIK